MRKSKRAPTAAEQAVIDEAEALREQIIQARAAGARRARPLRPAPRPPCDHAALGSSPLRSRAVRPAPPAVQVDSFEKLGREAVQAGYERPALASPYAVPHSRAAAAAAAAAA